MTTLSALQSLRAAYDAVTDDDIARVTRNFDPPKPGEKTLGVMHNMEARRLWAASITLLFDSIDATTRARFRAASDEEAAAFIAQGARAKGLAELARDLVWATVKDDLGAWGKATVGIRAGWMLVEGEAEEGGSGLLGALLASLRGQGGQGEGE